MKGARNEDERPDGAYQLTSLQIRDMVSYVHHSLWVIVDHDQKRLVFLVDYGPPNRKWRKSVEVWQRFVSQSRRSPFVNHQELTKVRRSRRSSDNLGGSESQGSSPLADQANGFFTPFLSTTNRFFPPVKRGPFYWLGGVVPAVRERWKVHGLYGCLGFEVRLADVVGINYLNELQTGGCLAVEASQVVKREFGNLREALAWYGRGSLQSGGAGSKSAVELGAFEHNNEAAEGGLVEQRAFGALRNDEFSVSRRESEEGGRPQNGGNKGAEQSVALNNIPPPSKKQWVQLSEGPPAAHSLSTELSLGPNSVPNKIEAEGVESRQDSDMRPLRKYLSETGDPTQVPEVMLTSPAYHSAHASPSVAGPCFGLASASGGASRRLQFGGVDPAEGPCPSSNRVGKVQLTARTTSSAEDRLMANGLEGDVNQTQSPEHLLAIASGNLTQQHRSEQRSAQSSSFAEASTSAPQNADSTRLGRPRGFLSSPHPSHSKLRFRRQRSRSLDDPVVKAVLDRVAEQAMHFATSLKPSDNRRHSGDPPLVTSSLSSAQQLENGAASLSALPRLRVTARAHQNSFSEPPSPVETSPRPAPVAEVYPDRLVVLRFRDPLLPDALRKAITTDQRLLKMLESGLPTWAILVQSYPALCHVYRPWMRRVAGYLYFIVSAVTVLIGFYDLYKNLPFVQDFLHRLLGPFYEWVDQWQMGARLGYLGTMLFLQNFQKALRAAQGVARSLQYLGSVVFRPVAVPLGLAAELFRPIGGALWGFALEAGALFAGVGSGVLAEIWYAAAYIVSPVVGFAQLILMAGLELMYPLWEAVSSALLLPLTLLASLFSGVAPLFPAVGSSLYATYASIAGAASIVKRVPARQAVSAAKAASNDGVFRGLWMSLYTVWSDLLWKVFGALRRIVFGFLAFVLEINKHRLSTYNHVVACLIEAEDATWQCIIGTEEIILSSFSRLGRYVTSSLTTNRHVGKSPESRLDFHDARDYFEEETD